MHYKLCVSIETIDTPNQRKQKNGIDLSIRSCRNGNDVPDQCSQTKNKID